MLRFVGMGEFRVKGYYGIIRDIFDNRIL